MTLKIGDKAPDFNLQNQDGEPVTLSDFTGKPALLAFYPAAFTGVCTKEMCVFRDSLAGLADLGGALVGISVDGRFSNAEFAKQNNLNFPLLSDYTRSTIKDYGVELHDFAGMQGYTAAQRAVFVVDAEGIIRWIWVADVPSVEPPYHDIRVAVEQL